MMSCFSFIFFLPFLVIESAEGGAYRHTLVFNIPLIFDHL